MKYIILLISLLLGVQLFCQDLEKTNFTLNDVISSYNFTENTVVGLKSMNDGLHYSTLVGDTVISKFSYKTGKKVADIVSVKELSHMNINYFGDYEFNSSESKIIFYVNRKDIYRRSFTAQYYVWDINQKKLYSVSSQPNQQLACLSPNGNKVAFVSKNNIYITELESGNEIQVTTDGKFNEIINGLPDWVYEEEFEYNKAFSWSPNGKYIAYCKWNETQVPTFNMTIFAGLFPYNKANKLYPENYTFKYPKAGEKNSLVNVHCYNVESGKTILLDSGAETNQYIPRVMWSPKNQVVFYRLNRLQNYLEFLQSNPETGESKVFYSECNDRYIDEAYFDYLTFLNKGENFIYVSESDGFLHLYLYNDKGEIVNRITKGHWDVTDYYGCDAKNNLIYYQSAETSPLQRDVFVCNIDGTGKRQLGSLKGTNSAVFSNGYNYYINYFSSVETPIRVTLYNAKGKQIRVLENNAELINRLAKKNFSVKEFFTFKTSQGVELNGWMVRPTNFNINKKYPVLMTQYSGPNSQSVTNDFSVGWEQVLAGDGYIVACVDGRGTAARGEDFRKLTYLQLGKYETIDQIETAKYLGGLSYIDSTRIGIWGWSYGGFMTLNCLTQGADYFKAGIAVAPVTNWRYYDNIYTERFMRTPQENPDGYDSNSPISHIEKLKGKLLLIHGTADDNVHMQNSVEISEALVQANKQFEMFYYTNRNHSIYGGNTRLHLYTKKLNFIKENL